LVPESGRKAATVSVMAVIFTAGTSKYMAMKMAGNTEAFFA
jgi:hypothetical protein